MIRVNSLRSDGHRKCVTLTMMRCVIVIAFALTAIIIITSGCARERPSTHPPIHLVPDMDQQNKYRPQAESKFFDDGNTMRSPVAGTVPRGYLRADSVYYLGKNADSSLVESIPVAITPELLRRGRERYDIYCSPCHSRVGDGRGIMTKRGYVPPPDFHSDRLREISDGHLFDVITNGLRNMPAYARQVPVDDRWAIVVYMRALQRSRSASIEDVPEQLRDQVRRVTP